MSLQMCLCVCVCECVFDVLCRPIQCWLRTLLVIHCRQHVLKVPIRLKIRGSGPLTQRERSFSPVPLVTGTKPLSFPIARLART